MGVCRKSIDTEPLTDEEKIQICTYIPPGTVVKYWGLVCWGRVRLLSLALQHSTILQQFMEQL